MSGNKLVQLLNQYKHEHTVIETNKLLEIKPITTGQMKAILQYENNDDSAVVEQVLDDIIDGCVVTEDFDVGKLTLQDRFELLLGIRKISKGTTYKFNIICPKCNSESMQFVDLETLEVLPIKSLDDRTVKINDNLSVTLDFVRREHQIESERIVGEMPGLSGIQKQSEIATYMYAFGMVGFETPQGAINDVSLEEKKEFLDALGATTYEDINDWYEKHNYGTVFKYKVDCKANDTCDFVQEEDIPITGFFF